MRDVVADRVGVGVDLVGVPDVGARRRGPDAGLARAAQPSCTWSRSSVVVHCFVVWTHASVAAQNWARQGVVSTVAASSNVQLPAAGLALALVATRTLETSAPFVPPGGDRLVRDHEGVVEEQHLRVPADVAAHHGVDGLHAPLLAVVLRELERLVGAVVVGDRGVTVAANRDRRPEPDVVAGRGLPAAEAVDVVLRRVRRRGGGDAVDLLPVHLGAVPLPDDEIAVRVARVPVGLGVAGDPDGGAAHRDRRVLADEPGLELGAVRARGRAPAGARWCCWSRSSPTPRCRRR